MPLRCVVFQQVDGGVMTQRLCVRSVGLLTLPVGTRLLVSMSLFLGARPAIRHLHRTTRARDTKRGHGNQSRKMYSRDVTLHASWIAQISTVASTAVIATVLSQQKTIKTASKAFCGG